MSLINMNRCLRLKTWGYMARNHTYVHHGLLDSIYKCRYNNGVKRSPTNHMNKTLGGSSKGGGDVA